jgi:low affinity Fe/Cu permease
MGELFHKFASAASNILGSAWAFIIAAASIIAWAITGPIFHFSDTWQLLANTGTTLVTFLMVFLIQNTQNRDAKAIHLKLDELIRGVAGARTGMVDLEDLSDEELARLQKEFQRLHEQMGHGDVKIDGGQVAAEEIQAGSVKADRVEAKEIVTEPQDNDQDEEQDGQRNGRQESAKQSR